MDQILIEFRRATRAILRAPVFATSAVLLLTFGIGTNAAVLSVVDAAFFRPLPVPNPEQIIEAWGGDSRDGSMQILRSLSFPDYLEIRDRIRGVPDLAAYAMMTLPLGDSLAGSSAYSAFVSGNYFRVLEVHAAMGRTLAPDEEQPVGAHPVVVVSDAFWKARLGASPDAVGWQITIGSQRFTVVGVMPQGFTGTQGEGRTDLWLPYTMQGQTGSGSYVYGWRDARVARLLGRMAQGATLAEVRGGFDAAARDLAATYPEADARLRFRVMVHDRLVPIQQAPQALSSMLTVWVMVALLHLVVCSNIASVMFARAAAKKRDIGIRLCLGASRFRVTVTALTEPAVLALLGGVGGLFLAQWLVSLVTGMQFLSAFNFGLDWRAVTIALSLAALSVVESGLAPARAAARGDPMIALRGPRPGRGHRGAMGPVMLQVGLSAVLLINASTLVLAYQRQVSGDPGYDAPHLLVGSFTATPEQRLTDWVPGAGDLLQRLAAVPGVAHVAFASSAPLGHGNGFEEVEVKGHEYVAGESRNVSIQMIGPEYFATIGAPLLRGREFTADDRRRGDGSAGFDAVIVNESMARHFWPGLDPIGRQVSFRRRGAATVVGVVRDIHDVKPAQAYARMYFPLLQWRLYPAFDVIVRTSGSPDAVKASVRSIAASTTLPVTPPVVRNMPGIIRDAESLQRVGSVGLSACALAAILLTAIGLYGLVSTWGAERRGELGIRMALGARAGQLQQMLVFSTGRLVALGGAAGAAGAMVLLRLEQSWWGSSFAFQLLPFAAAIAIITLIALVAAYIPSRRATRVDPADVLRQM